MDTISTEFTVVAGTKLYLGEDAVLKLQLKDADGVDLDINVDIVDIRAFLCIDGRQVDKYSLVSATGYKTISIDGSDPSIAKLLIDRVNSKNFPVGDMTIEYLVTSVHPDFPSGKNHVFVFDVLPVEQSKSKSDA